ncbi:rhoptry protein [Plasmodium ovale wallikeri]|uniref:Rhoptry protein n=1 Tax=Plasmodium ovale wallikeri TaxID=864142 RepID=A0A1A8YYP7_PLAOA|nr:rhoptry protein [Plasmodium ovale wallikeri]
MLNRDPNGLRKIKIILKKDIGTISISPFFINFDCTKIFRQVCKVFNIKTYDYKKHSIYDIIDLCFRSKHSLHILKNIFLNDLYKQQTIYDNSELNSKKGYRKRNSIRKKNTEHILEILDDQKRINVLYFINRFLYSQKTPLSNLFRSYPSRFSDEDTAVGGTCTDSGFDHVGAVDNGHDSDEDLNLDECTIDYLIFLMVFEKKIEQKFYNFLIKKIDKSRRKLPTKEGMEADEGSSSNASAASAARASIANLHTQLKRENYKQGDIVGTPTIPQNETEKSVISVSGVCNIRGIIAQGGGSMSRQGCTVLGCESIHQGEAARESNCIKETKKQSKMPHLGETTNDKGTKVTIVNKEDGHECKKESTNNRTMELSNRVAVKTSSDFIDVGMANNMEAPAEGERPLVKDEEEREEQEEEEKDDDDDDDDDEAEDCLKHKSDVENEITLLKCIRPFPTVYWLINKNICGYISHLEKINIIKNIEAFINRKSEDLNLLRYYIIYDHLKYIVIRLRHINKKILLFFYNHFVNSDNFVKQYTTKNETIDITMSTYSNKFYIKRDILNTYIKKYKTDEHVISEILRKINTLRIKGIGGISNFLTLKCIHLYFASHLSYPNTIGYILEECFKS